MIRLLTVVLFPLLGVLAITAPDVVPWLFGAEWEPAVVPTQILAAGGAATLVCDAAGSALQAQGRSRALLGFGVAHFAAYLGAVLLVADRGLDAVAIAASAVHSAFVVIIYITLFRSAPVALRELVGDLGPSLTATAALAAATTPLTIALREASAPVPLLLAAAALVAATTYLTTLRVLFPAAAADLFSALRRILPSRLTRGKTPAPAATPVAVGD
jgi:PST family polysaccharide transporter